MKGWTVPTYQYACTECGHDFEAVQSFSDDALTECPQCQGRLRKVFSAVGVVFKGSGFYRTDSRSTATKGGGSSGSSAEGTGTAAATTSTGGKEKAASTPASGSAGSATTTSSSSAA